MRSLVSTFCALCCLEAFQALLTFTYAAGADSIVVHLLRAPGYGPFAPALRLSYPGENGGPLERAIAEVRGIPVDMHGFSVRYANLQPDQYIYQSYREGLVDPTFAREYFLRNGTDTAKLTAKYVSQDVPVVVGYDGDGNFAYVVDTKDDHSFWGKDRIVVPAFSPGKFSKAQMDSLNDLIEKPVVTYEYFDGRKVQEADVTFRIFPYVQIPPERAAELRGKFVFGMGTYEYRRGVFTNGERKFMCAVSNGFQTGVYGARGDEFTFFPAEDSSTVTSGTILRYRLGDRVEIGDEILRIASIAVDGSSVTLKKEKPVPAHEGIAVGSIARDFSLRSLAGEEVNLGRFRGKYLLLEFWHPGSDLCIADIPYLNDISDAYPPAKISVVGMALQVGPPLGAFAASRSMRWLQVPVSDTSRVLRAYAVGGYPSTFLIDPNGMVVANGRLQGPSLFGAVAAALHDSTSLVSLVSKGNVAFRFEEGGHKMVEVAGDFSGWLPLPLYRTGSGFSRRVALSPGRYHYRFVVDGTPTTDPSNPETEDASGAPENILVVP